jgi:hypothetical protein
MLFINFTSKPHLPNKMCQKQRLEQFDDWISSWFLSPSLPPSLPLSLPLSSGRMGDWSRTFCFLGRHSTTWAAQLDLFAFIIFWIGSHIYAQTSLDCDLISSS